MKLVIEIPKGYRALLNEGYTSDNIIFALQDAVKNGSPLVEVLTDFVEWQGLPFPQKNIFMNAPILIAETYLKEKKNETDSD